MNLVLTKARKISISICTIVSLISFLSNQCEGQAEQTYVAHPLSSGKIKQTIYDPFEQRLLILSQDGFREFKNGKIKKLELQQSYRRYLSCIPKKDTLLIFDTYFNITYCDRNMEIIKVVKFDEARNHFLTWLNEYFIYSRICPHNTISTFKHYYVSDGKTYLLKDNSLSKISENNQLTYLGELPDLLSDSVAINLLRNSGLTLLTGPELRKKYALYKKYSFSPYRLGWLLYPNLMIYENEFIHFTDSNDLFNAPVVSQMEHVITTLTKVNSNEGEFLFVGTTHGLQVYNFKEFITQIKFDNTVQKKSNILFNGSKIEGENKLLLSNGYLLNTSTNSAISFSGPIIPECLTSIPEHNAVVYYSTNADNLPTLNYAQWVDGQCIKGHIPISQKPLSLFCLSSDSIIYTAQEKLFLIHFKDRDQPKPKEKVIGTYENWTRVMKKFGNSYFILSEQAVYEVKNTIYNKERTLFLKDTGAQNIDTLNQELLLFSYGNGVYKILGEGNTQKLEFSNDLAGKFIHGIIHENSHLLLLTDYGLFYTSYSAFIKGMQTKSVIHIVPVDFVSSGKPIEFNSTTPYIRLSDHRYAAMSQSGLVLIDMKRLNNEIFPIFRIKINTSEFEVSETPQSIRNDNRFLNISLVQEHKLYSLQYPYSIWVEVNGKSVVENRASENSIPLILDEGENKVLIHILDPILNQGYDKLFTIVTPISWYNLAAVKFTFFLAALFILAFIFYTSYRYYRLRKVKGELNSFIKTQFSLIETEAKNLDMASLNFKRELTETELLLSSAVHDLATPLRFFRSITDHLKKHWSTLDEGTKKEQVDSLAYSAYQIKTLSDEFLLFIRNKVDKEYDYHPAPFLLKEQISRLSSYYDWVKNIREFKIEVSIEEDIIIEFDKEILAVVFRNLIDNVVKHSGTKLVQIYSAQSSDDNQVAIEIEYDSPSTDLNTINELNNMLTGDFESGHVGLGFKLIRLALKISNTQMRFKKSDDDHVIIIWELLQP